jgi:hypothetical protein
MDAPDDIHPHDLSSELAFRQVHLDFHTSEHIPDVGIDFDGDRFSETLKRAHVNSVTCFSKCHHGFVYHDTRFQCRHPNLRINLLAEQIRACHAADIRAPIYISAGWDHFSAIHHPEWIEIDQSGRQVGRSPIGTEGRWYNMDFASPYMDHLIAQTEEVLDIFGDEVDGLFFDAILVSGVHSVWALERFRQLHLDPTNVDHQNQMKELLSIECTDRLSAAIRKRKMRGSLFFNSGHVGPQFRKFAQNYSHLEIESLPTGGWGYTHFPVTVRYARTLGKGYLGMTGRFSETWGHFNSYKVPAALEFECLSMIAQGAKCSIGDQLHPRGVLDPATYELIAPVYEKIEARELWCKGAMSVTEIAVMNAEEFERSGDRMDPRNLGAARMLIEGRHQFDLIDSQADLSNYNVVILPDVIEIDGALRSKIEKYLSIGGNVIASYKSGNNLPGMPGEILGELPFSPDFMRPTARLFPKTTTDFVMYERGLIVAPMPGAEILATISIPYFDRTFDRFTSHFHSPVDRTTTEPAVLKLGQVIYFAHPIFATYGKHSMLFHRDVVLKALEMFLPEPLIKVEAPSVVQASLTRVDESRIVHLLFYVPERRGLNFEIVEDALPIENVPLSLRGAFNSARLVPEGDLLPIERNGAYTTVQLPKMVGHQMIEFI